MLLLFSLSLYFECALLKKNVFIRIKQIMLKTLQLKKWNNKSKTHTKQPTV